MAGAFVLNLKKYAIFVKVLAGEGDGQVISLDSHGNIHVTGGGGGDPERQREKFQTALKQIEAGVTAFHAAAEEPKVR